MALPSSRIEVLESVRGLAAVAVVVSHLITAFADPFTTGRPHGVDLDSAGGVLLAILFYPIKEGLFSVMVFFVLSGVVLSQSYLKTARFSEVTGGLLRRYPRLAIPAAASAVLACLLWLFGAMHNVEASHSLASAGVPADWLGAFVPQDPSLGDALRQGGVDVFFSPTPPRAPEMYNCVLWTMRTEFWGSVLVFAMLGLVGTQPKFGLIAFAVALLFVACGQTRLALFPAGVCFAVVRRDWPTFRLGWFATSVCALTAFALCGWYRIGDYEPAPLWPGGPSYVQSDLVTGAAAVLTVAAAMFSPTLSNALAARLFVWLGKISFGLYLVHLPIILSLGSLVIVRALPVTGYPGAFAAASVAVLIVAIPSAWLFYSLVDRTAVWVGRQIVRLVARP
jgi:peptidoglycan/LPS O-acetylase OafA/YrhL